MNQQEVYKHIIDGCDEALRDAFLRRMELSLKIAESRLGGTPDIYSPEREADVIDAVSNGLTPELGLKAQSLWRSLLRMSRGRQYHHFITHNPDYKLPFEADLLTAPPPGPVLCAQKDADLAAAALGLETRGCESAGRAIAELESGRCSQAALVLDNFYDSERLFSDIFQRRIYVNAIVRAEGGRHIFLLSKNLFDLPENDMLTVAFAVQTDQHGSLAQTLEIFSDLKINLEFLRFKTADINDDNRRQRNIVFADLNGKLLSIPMRAALMQVEAETPFCRVLGYRQRLEEV